MIEVYSRLFVGSELDYEGTVSHQSGWTVVHACKEHITDKLWDIVGELPLTLILSILWLVGVRD